MNLEKIQHLIDRQEFAEAKKLLQVLLQQNKTNTDAFYLLAIAEAELGNPKEATQILSRILNIEPRHAAAHYTMAGLLIRLNKHEDAMPHHDFAVSLLSSNPWAYVNRGNSLAALKKFQDALLDFDAAIGIDPNSSSAFQNKGSALLELGLFKDSLSSLEKALDLNPFNVEALSNKSACLLKLKLPEESLATANKALQLKPEYAEAWSNRGIALNDLKRHEEALGSYERSIELKPDYAEAWSNRGNALNDLKRHEEALASYEQAWKLKPSIDFLLGSLIRTQMKICDWTDLDSRLGNLQSGLAAKQKCSNPFSILGLFDNPELQRSAAEVFAKDKCQASSQLGPLAKPPKGEKIRIGYFSMDFREHPVAYLTADLFELHDRNRFEVYAFSFGANNQDLMRRKLERSFDKFLDVSHLSDLDIARLSRELHLHIAIDLGGHTKDSRPQIFSEKAAPIQVNYLGYPGTWGHPCMDYFIGDKTTITSENRDHFSEKIVYMPDQFQANPISRPTSEELGKRAELGLPDDGVVFCCFNNNWKITPMVFVSWMRILQGVPNSVLWLYADNQWAAKNLVAKAGEYGILSDRLIFSGRVSREKYIAQYRHADLFLDTLPYNAGTTASDALWAGLPVLTLIGESFAGRMAASLLEVVGLPGLITHSIRQYETLAIELAKNPVKLASLKTKLAQNRLSATLFDTPRFTKHLESAYTAMHERYHADLSPDHIYVKP